MMYALLIYSDEAAEAPMPQEEQEAALVKHRALQEETATTGTLRSVLRLQNKSEAKTIRTQGGTHLISEGPYMDTKEWLVGLYMIDCEDEHEALEHGKRLVTSARHCIEVRPAQWHRHE